MTKHGEADRFVGNGKVRSTRVKIIIIILKIVMSICPFRDFTCTQEPGTFYHFSHWKITVPGLNNGLSPFAVKLVTIIQYSHLFLTRVVLDQTSFAISLHEF